MADEIVEMEQVQPAAEPLPEVTTAAQWRQKARARWRVTLPSGVVVEAKRPDFTELIGQGVIDGDALVSSLAATTTKDRYERMMPIARAAVSSIVLNPVISQAQNGDGTICVDDIQSSDLMALLLWAGGWATSPMPAVAIPD